MALPFLFFLLPLLAHADISEEYLRLMTSPEMRGLTSPVPSKDRELRDLAAIQGKKLVTQSIRIIVEKPRFTGKKVHEASFGPLNVTDDARALLAAKLVELKALVDKGVPVRLTLKSGTYRFRSKGTAVDLSGFRDFELRGSGQTRFEFTDPKATGVAIQNCQRVRVADLTIDYDYPVSFGQIAYAARALGGGRIEVPALAEPEKIGAVFSYDPDEGTYFHNDSAASHLPLEGDEKPTLVSAAVPTYEHSSFKGLVTGERLIVLHSRVGFQNALRALGKENADITVESVTLHSYPQMGFAAAGFRGLHFKNNRVVPRAGAKISGRADAFHVNGMVGDVLIEGNEARGQGDDGLNVRGTDLSLRKPFDAASDTVTIKETWDAFTEPGDLLVVQTNGNQPLAFVRVVRRKGPSLQLNWGTCDPACRRKIATSLAAVSAADKDQVGIAFNLTRATTRAYLFNNRFSFSAGRGTLLQSPNAVARRNEYRNVAGAAILATSENGSFIDGPGPMNVAIVGNTAINANVRQDEGHPQRNAAIAVACAREEGLTGGTIPDGIFPTAFGVLVRGNTIKARAYAGVLATFARDVEISANSISETALHWKEGDVAFLKEPIATINSTEP